MIAAPQIGFAPARPVLPVPSPLTNSALLSSPYLSPDERRALDAAVSSVRTITANTDLVAEGTRADNLFIIIKGWACRYSTTADGGRQISALLVPGDVGNLDSLMFDRIDYGARTLTPATVVALSRDRALALAAEHPGIARTFTWAALVENAILSKWALSLGRRSSRERLAHLLCELAVRLDSVDGNTSSFPLPLTQEHLADALGLTSVHVNRTMQQLRGEGLMVTANRTVTLPDMARLREIGGFDPGYLHLTVPREGVR